MSETPYGTMWESYWADLPQGPRQAIWDTPADIAARLHLELCEPAFGGGLPVVDLGCGNGTQTALLASRFGHVVGVDVAESALRRARAENAAPGLEYRRLDVLDRDAVAALHAELGDAHVYDRTLLHQLGPGDWTAGVQALSVLAGGSGSAFLVELGPRSQEYMVAMTQRYGRLPKLAQALEHGIRPAALPEERLTDLLRHEGFRVTGTGTLDYLTTQDLPDGGTMVIPAHYVLATKRPGRAPNGPR